jgi:hypothetical protein
VEDLFADQRIEVLALIANAKLRNVDDAYVSRFRRSMPIACELSR